MATPDWNQTAKSSSSFGRSTRAISGATTLDPICKAIIMLTAGDITVTPADTSTTCVFVGLAAGYVIPFQCKAATATAGVATTID